MNKEEWNRFVEEHPESSFFHRYEWKGLIEDVFGFKAHYMAAKDDLGKVQGVLPLFEVDQKRGKRLISMPFSTEGGILSNNENAKNYLLEHAKEIAEEDGADYVELRQEKDIGGEGLAKKDYYYHMKLRLGPDPGIIWEGADRKMRNAVRKARKLGLTTDRGTHYLEDFYRIFSINMRDLGTPVDKKEFFEEMIKRFPGKIDIVAAKLKGKVIGAVFLIRHKKTIKSEWASSLRKYFGYNANQLMYWRAIEDACREGFEVFDFGRSMEDEGTYIFKKKFGAKPVQLHYRYFLNKAEEMPDTRKTNWKRKVFAGVWRNMPLFIANRLGPKIRSEFP